MDIQLAKIHNYRSFKNDFVATSLNPLIVLTGKNGVGKTQLLQLIDWQQFFHPSDKRFNVVISINGQVIHEDEVLGIFNWQAGSAPSAGLPEISVGIANATAAVTNKLGNSDFDRKAYSLSQRNVLGGIVDQLRELGYNSSSRIPSAEIVEKNLPIEFFDQSPQIFNERIAALVFDWHLGRIEANEAGRELPDALSDPILIFNELCKEFELKYRLPQFTTLRKNYLPRLETDQGDSVDWNELSSGEMVLFRIVCWLFYAHIEKAYYPKLLLLDEPDAHLSPAMINKVLDKIQSVVVESMKINVIMTTHSPNTVALAKEDALYELNYSKDNTHTVSKISRKKAITTFSDGLLFVETDTRLVFVEGKSDVSFYDNSLKAGLMKHGLKPIPSLKIIAVSKVNRDNGGCEEVKKLCDKFRGTTIENLVFGVIDSDNKNEPKSNLLVLKRYAIENYLYDPVIMVGSLLIQGQQHLIKTIEGLETNDLRKLYENPELLQLSVNEVIKKFETIASQVITDSGHGKGLVKQMFHIKYLEKPVEYSLPEWFLKLKKSTLMKQVIRIQANTLEKYTKEKHQLLCLDAIGGIHADVLDLFTELQANR